MQVHVQYYIQMFLLQFALTDMLMPRVGGRPSVKRGIIYQNKKIKDSKKRAKWRGKTRDIENTILDIDNGLRREMALQKEILNQGKIKYSK